MRVFLVSGRIGRGKILRNLCHVVSHNTVCDDVIVGVLKKHQQLIVRHHLALVVREALTIQQRKNLIDPGILACLADFPQIMRLRDVAIIDLADLSAGTNCPLTHGVRCLFPCLPRRFRSSVVRVLAKGLTNEVTHVPGILNEPKPSTIDALQRIKQLRAILVLNASSSSVNASHDLSYGGIGMQIALIGEPFHLTNSLILTKHLSGNISLSLQRLELDLLDVLTSRRSNAIIVRELRPRIGVRPAKRSHDLSHVRHDRITIFRLDVLASHGRNRRQTLLSHCWIPPFFRMHSVAFPIPAASISAS